jgi:probable F420-dependent oxidoreductase
VRQRAASAVHARPPAAKATAPAPAVVLRHAGGVTDDRRFRVGVQLHPQQTTLAEIRAAWRRADALGVDTIWVWDHFFPLYGRPDGPHFEAWTLLSAAGADTVNARLGTMVSAIGYRNPDLVADMVRTLDHLTGGRAILGLGAGWSQRDYREYGYDFGTRRSRLAELEAALPRIRRRLDRLSPPPVQQRLPILIGGGGEKVTLRLVAQHAQMWNTFGPPSSFAHKNQVLDDWCRRLGRDPAHVERTVLVEDSTEVVPSAVAAYLRSGAEHVIFGVGAPYDLSPVEALLRLAGG